MYSNGEGSGRAESRKKGVTNFGRVILASYNEEAFPPLLVF